MHKNNKQTEMENKKFERRRSLYDIVILSPACGHSVDTP